MQNNRPIQILFAEDHNAIQEIFKGYLDDSDDFEIIKITSTVRDTLEQLQRSRYDLIILDLHLPQNRLSENSILSGYEILEHIKTLKLEVQSLILSGSEEQAYISKALSKGASGYLSKKVDAVEFREAIRTIVFEKKVYVEKNLNIQVNVLEVKNILTLNQREKRLLFYLGEGLTSREIADKMCLAHDTIRDYRDNLIKKFKAKNSVNLIKIATENGYLPRV